MPDPITFTTETERLKAREQHLHLCRAIYPGFEAEVVARDFDRAFPPIAPPKMVPFEAWMVVEQCNGARATRFGPYTTRPTPADGFRVARVRVEEVDDE